MLQSPNTFVDVFKNHDHTTVMILVSASGVTCIIRTATASRRLQPTHDLDLLVITDGDLVYDPLGPGLGCDLRLRTPQSLEPDPLFASLNDLDGATPPACPRRIQLSQGLAPMPVGFSDIGEEGMLWIWVWRGRRQGD